MSDNLYLIGPEYLEKTAKVVGGQSAAAQALRDYRRRVEQGEEPAILYDPKHGSIYVCATVDGEG